MARLGEAMGAGYKLDPRRSRFTVQAFATGLLSIFAHSPTIAIREFAGELEFAADAPAAAKFHLTVKADSLQVTDPISPKDRAEIERVMREDVLEIAKYPEVTYTSTQIAATRIADNWYRLQISGKLALHGVTRDQPIEAQLAVRETEIRLSGGFTLLQSSYQIQRPAAMGRMILAKDELKFVFDVVGEKENL